MKLIIGQICLVLFFDLNINCILFLYIFVIFGKIMKAKVQYVYSQPFKSLLITCNFFFCDIYTFMLIDRCLTSNFFAMTTVALNHWCLGRAQQLICKHNSQLHWSAFTHTLSVIKFSIIVLFGTVIYLCWSFCSFSVRFVLVTSFCLNFFKPFMCGMEAFLLSQ